MSFELTDHTSEIGFRADGETLAAAFEAAGQALFQIMTDIADLEERDKMAITVESESLEALLFDFIDELIYIAEADGMLCKRFDLAINEADGGYILTGTGFGEPIGDQARLQDVKAPTYSELRVEQTDGGWELAMVLDV